MPKNKIWQAETFSRNQANRFYEDGPRLLMYGFAVLLATSVAYFGITMKADFEMVDPKDEALIRAVLTSGAPWLVLCKRPADEMLPSGFEKNLKSLGVTKAAVMDCTKPLPESGVSIIAKYKLDTKRGPVGFLSVGGKRTQLDPKLLDKDDNLELGKLVRKTVAKRYALGALRDAIHLKTTCAKLRCVLWGDKLEYYGPKRAVENPKWSHFRVPAGTKIEGQNVNGAIITWVSNDVRYAITVKGDEELHKAVKGALDTVDEDMSFALEKAKKLEWDWVTIEKSRTARPTPVRSSSAQEKSETKTSRPTPHPTMAKSELFDDDNDDQNTPMSEDDDGDEGIDLDEM